MSKLPKNVYPLLLAATLTLTTGLARAYSELGENIAAANPFSQSWMFTNLMRQSELGVPLDGDGRVVGGSGAFPQDSNGYASAFPPGVSSIFYLVQAADIPDPLMPPPSRAVANNIPGEYVIRWEGDGDFLVHGCAESARSANEIRCQLQPDDYLHLTLERIGSPHPTNIRVIVPGGICNDDPFVHASQPSDCNGGQYTGFSDIDGTGIEGHVRYPFHPEFLADYQFAAVLRFMDILDVNRLPIAVRNGETDTGQADFGLAPSEFNIHQRPPSPQIIADLGNVLAADVWVNMPHRASDSYITRFAEILRDRLHTGRTVYVEYSNEIWNGGFYQTEYVNREGCQAYSADPAGECDPDGAGPEPLCSAFGVWMPACMGYGITFYANQSAHVMQLWRSTFNQVPDAPNLQAVFAYRAGALWEGNGPLAALRNVAADFDVYAINGYFSGFTASSTDDLFVRTTAPVLQAGTPAPGTGGFDTGVFEVISNHWDPFGGVLQWTQSDIAILRDASNYPELAHINIAAYEGGQHYHVDASSRAANNDPRMYDVYLQFLTLWDQVTAGGLFVHFQGKATNTFQGLFSSAERQGAPSPKWNALVDFAATGPNPADQLLSALPAPNPPPQPQPPGPAPVQPPAPPAEPVQPPDTLQIVHADWGGFVVFNSTYSDLPDHMGYGVVFAEHSQPEYAKDMAYARLQGDTTAYLPVGDVPLYVRLCLLDFNTDTCDRYSDEVVILPRRDINIIAADSSGFVAWESSLQHLEDHIGYAVVFSSSPDPVYGVDAAYARDQATLNAYLPVDAAPLHVRVCVLNFSTNQCDNYSHPALITPATSP